jgi:hypothetical protein
MFRTRVIYLWLQMVGAFMLLLLAAATAAPFLAADVTIPMTLALFFVLALLALGGAVVGALPMLVLLQRLLVAVGAHAGRPADFTVFRRWLLGYSLVPAAVPLLAFALPSVRANAGLGAALLATWALATIVVWAGNARRLHREWEAGVPY